MTAAAGYSARETEVDGIAVVQLADAARAIEVSIAPAIGNMAYEINCAGQNILWLPDGGLAKIAKARKFCAVPFLAPWANRISEDAYWANGKRYLLNPGLGNVRRDKHHTAIHGLLSFSSAWARGASGADERSAYASSSLEFGRYPDLMAQFPFAHTITMTHRLAEGELEVETVLENQSSEPMPVAIGYHPYFRLPEVPRDQWHVHLAARDHLVLDSALIPTGERRPVEFADPHPLREMPLDDVFADLVPSADGRARFWVEGNGRKITVAYGPKYTVAIVYAPAGHDFICFEPMAAITNAFNLAHAGVYRELQSVPPGGEWRESFWIAVG